MFALCLYQKTAQGIASAHRVALNKIQPVTLTENAMLLWAYDWVEVDRPGGTWLLVTQSRRDADRLLATKDGTAELKAGTAVEASAMFGLCLHHKTAQRIASVHRVVVNKDQPIKLAENTVLLWAYDWTEEGKPGGTWLLLTPSRQDSTRLLDRPKPKP